MRQVKVGDAVYLLNKGHIPAKVVYVSSSPEGFVVDVRFPGEFCGGSVFFNREEGVAWEFIPPCLENK